jgi:hypothetical protein
LSTITGGLAEFFEKALKSPSLDPYTPELFIIERGFNLLPRPEELAIELLSSLLDIEPIKIYLPFE